MHTVYSILQTTDYYRLQKGIVCRCCAFWFLIFVFKSCFFLRQQALPSISLCLWLYRTVQYAYPYPFIANELQMFIPWHFLQLMPPLRTQWLHCIFDGAARTMQFFMQIFHAFYVNTFSSFFFANFVSHTHSVWWQNEKFYKTSIWAEQFTILPHAFVVATGIWCTMDAVWTPMHWCHRWA